MCPLINTPCFIFHIQIYFSRDTRGIHVRAAIKKHHTPQTTLEGPDPLTRRPRDTLVGHRGHSDTARGGNCPTRTRARTMRTMTPNPKPPEAYALPTLYSCASAPPHQAAAGLPSQRARRRVPLGAPRRLQYLLGERHSLRLHGRGQLGGDRNAADALHGPAWMTTDSGIGEFGGG